VNVQVAHSRKFDLLTYFVRHPLSREQLLRTIREAEYAGGSNVVDSCVSALRTKLGGRPRLIQTVRSVGYSLRE
jgi:DNA-binding response OmpR family regulator